MSAVLPVWGDNDRAETVRAGFPIVNSASSLTVVRLQPCVASGADSDFDARPDAHKHVVRFKSLAVPVLIDSDFERATGSAPR